MTWTPGSMSRLRQYGRTAFGFVIMTDVGSPLVYAFPSITRHEGRAAPTRQTCGKCSRPLYPQMQALCSHGHSTAPIHFSGIGPTCVEAEHRSGGAVASGRGRRVIRLDETSAGAVARPVQVSVNFGSVTVSVTASKTSFTGVPMRRFSVLSIRLLTTMGPSSSRIRQTR